MPSLVLEGGTFRPIFSCGVMDALLDADIMFPYCIGVSAGISQGVSYVSRQQKRNLDVILQYRNDKRYLGISNYPKCNSVFGLDFIFGELPDRLAPFDWEVYRRYDGTFLVGVTNVKTGKIEYKDGKHMDEKFTMLRATCALPIFFPMIELDGNKYLDGGITDPIPIRKAIQDGNKRHLILLTRPKGYRKTLNKQTILASNIYKKKYPEFAQALLRRHVRYNKTIELCEKLEEKGKAIILRPYDVIDSFEKNTDILKANYIQGYAMAKERIEEIKGLF